MPMQLLTAVEEALRFLRPTLPSSIEIVKHIDCNTPTVIADPAQVQQVLANLVTNAWQAVGLSPGRIELRLEPCDVDEELARAHPDLRPQHYARLSVSDTGHGMNATTLERVFEPFFTTKDPGRGTGLGLSVVHGIMRSCDGAITVESEVRHGSTFRLYFPAVAFDPESAAKAAPLELRRGRGERVLFVDDEPALATLGALILKRLNYEVVTHTDPRLALDQFRNERFDLVITDLTMPHLSGLDLGRQMLELRPGIPIILTSGYSASLSAERVRALAFHELLMKPYTVETLSECIGQVLRSGEARQS